MIALLAVFCGCEKINLNDPYRITGLRWFYDPDVYTWTQRRLVGGYWYGDYENVSCKSWWYFINREQPHEWKCVMRPSGGKNPFTVDFNYNYQGYYDPDGSCLFGYRFRTNYETEWSETGCLYENPNYAAPVTPTAHFTPDMSPTWQLYDKPIVAVNIFLGLFTDFYIP